METPRRNPRVLVVTPEITYLPDRMGNLASFFTAKAGGLADVSASLVSALFDQGADVHVALPHYRSMFSDRLVPFLKEEITSIQRKMPDDRVHLAEDRVFFYINRVYSQLRGRKHQARARLPARGHQQHHPARAARPDPLQRLDDRAHPGRGPAAADPLPVHDSQHPHREDAPSPSSRTAASMPPASGSTCTT